MENLYNDEILPENFEEIAKAYSANLKNKGFVFVKLEEEAFELLVDEVFVILAKMRACIEKLDKKADCSDLDLRLEKSQILLKEKFKHKKMHTFRCIQNENGSFLTLIALENTLVLKLMLLSLKSGEIELCNDIISSICGVFAQSFSSEGFLVD